MRPTPSQARFDKRSPRWNFMSSEEKSKEFKELVSSPYWHFLPEELQDRLRRYLHD